METDVLKNGIHSKIDKLQQISRNRRKIVPNLHKFSSFRFLYQRQQFEILD